MYPAHSWSRDPLGQTILGGVLPTRGLTVQGLGQEAMGPQQVAQTPDLGHSGTTPLASKEEPDGTPPKNLNLGLPRCHPHGRGTDGTLSPLLTVRAWIASHSCGDWIL